MLKPLKLLVSRLSRVSEELASLRQTLVEKATKPAIRKESLMLTTLSEKCRAASFLLEELYLYMDEVHDELRHEFLIELDT